MSLPLFGCAPGLVNGWLGTAAQQRAVEQMFGISIAIDSVERGWWTSNYWTNVVSTAETHAADRCVTEVASVDASPAVTGCMVRSRCLPAYKLGLIGMRGACLEFFEQFYLEHHAPKRGDAPLDAARRRAMPSSAVWQVVGYISPEMRIVRQVRPGSGLDLHGLPLDVRDAPLEGGDSAFSRFALVRGSPQAAAHAKRHVPPFTESISYGTTFWGDQLTIHVHARVHRGAGAWPADPPGAPAFSDAARAYSEVQGRAAATEAAAARRDKRARAFGWWRRRAHAGVECHS